MIERHTLGSIKESLRTEFGMEDSAHTNSVLADRINRALTYIVNYRAGRWSWLRKEASIDVTSAEVATFSFTNKRNTAVVVSGNVPAIRQCLFIDGHRYTVTEVSGTTVTFRPSYLGNTGEAEATVATIYYLLPEDFIAWETKDLVTDLAGNSFKSYDIQRFQYIRNRSAFGVDKAYCIMVDPISVDKTSKYIAVHPYFTTDNAILFTYYALPDKLVNDSDEPPMDIKLRGLLLNMSLWFVATSVGHEKALTYRDTALDELQRAAKDFDVDDTHEFDQSNLIQLDLSNTLDVDFTGDSDFAPVTIT
jgi:hypothetical protein